MRLLLVRHAVALRRRDWVGDDLARPLTPRGVAQAEALPDRLRDYEVKRILSSPFVRCIDTVHPLAVERGLPVEETAELAEGRGTDLATRLDRDEDAAVVLCSHGDVLPQLLVALVPVLPEGEVICQKGSVWIVEAAPGRVARATYLPPPA